MLKFSPYAWAKMHYLRDKGDTEVSFMGITSRDALDVVTDVRMVPQECTSVYTEFKEEGLADFFEDMVDEGYHPEQFGRIWCHTHPGNSASPSGTDDETFKREFSAPNWAIMFILAKDSSYTCRLKYKVHPELQNLHGYVAMKQEISAGVDWSAYSREFNCDAVTALWTEEYTRCWSKKAYSSGYSSYSSNNGSSYQPYNWNQHHKSPYQRKSYAVKKDGKEYPEFNQYTLYLSGWRITPSGSWTMTPAWKDEDKQDGFILSRDSHMGFPSVQKWEEYGCPSLTEVMSVLDDELVPKPFKPETTNNGKLTKREKKYMKNHNGSLAGFVPPVNSGSKGAKPLMVPLQKLETDRNLLSGRDEQSDVDWLEESSKAYENVKVSVGEHQWSEYTVTLDNGCKVHNVWARTQEEAHEWAALCYEEECRKNDCVPGEILEMTLTDDENIENLDLEDALQTSLAKDPEPSTLPMIPLLPQEDDTELELASSEGLANFSQHARDFSTDGYDVLG